MSRGPSITARDIPALLQTLDHYADGITREELHDVLSRSHRKMSDSQIRIAIEDARAAGHLIITTFGAPRKYKFAASFEEYDDWRRRDPMSRAMRLLTEIRHMDESAARTWPPQLELGVA